jgi:hypothetical protein
MKIPTAPVFLVLAALLWTGSANAQGASVPIQVPTKAPVPVPTPIPTPTPNPKAPVTVACPTAVLFTAVNGSNSVTIAGEPYWNLKSVSKPQSPLQAHRSAGAHSDVLWCDYKATSDETSAWMQGSAVQQAPLDHPKCTVGADQKSFSCRSLGSGETY